MKQMSHKQCAHAATKAARQKCRDERKRYEAEPTAEEWYDAHTDEDKAKYEYEIPAEWSGSFKKSVAAFKK